MKWFLYNSLGNYLCGISELLTQFIDLRDPKISILIRILALGGVIYLLKEYTFSLDFLSFLLVILGSMLISTFKILIRNTSYARVSDNYYTEMAPFIAPVCYFFFFISNMLILGYFFQYKLSLIYYLFTIGVFLLSVYKISLYEKKFHLWHKRNFRDSLYIVIPLSMEWITALSYIAVPESTLYSFIFIEFYEMMCLYISKRDSQEISKEETTNLTFRNVWLILGLTSVKILFDYMDYFLCLDPIALGYSPVVDTLSFWTYSLMFLNA